VVAADQRRLAAGILDRLVMLVRHPLDQLGQQRVAVAQFTGDGVDSRQASSV
jgi:hypothetical protein